MDTNVSEVRNVLLGGWVTAKANIIAAGQNLLKGTVLSEIKSTAAAAADAGNTGDGTVGDISVGPLVKKGVYQLICNGSGFNIISPEGDACGYAVADEPFTSRELNLTITASTAAFVAGDFFTITVSGTGKHKMVAADATDGTGTAEQVLMLDVDALDADVPSKGWESGEFDAALLIVPEGESIAAYRDQMRAKSMIQIETVGGNY
jgi:hypothetical protein